MEKKWLYLLGILIVGLFSVYVYRRYRVAPSFDFNRLELVDIQNKPVSFQQFKGLKTVLFFSASWCPNCITELRDVNSVKEQLNDVNIIVISDEPIEKVRSFAERTAYPFIFLKMVSSFNTVGIHSIPTSYVLTQDLQTVKETVGYVDWKDPSILQLLK